MIKLSLIVPIYGVEKYIGKFLTTLEKNLQKDIEVLLIDDGSKDNSGKIADEFALKHQEYVTVIHKENGGVSDARNKGLQISKGEYVLFPDPDDLLAEDYVMEVLSAIDRYNTPDLIFFDYYVGDSIKDWRVNTVSTLKEGLINKRDFVDEFIKDKFIKSFVWNKVIRKSLFTGLEFNTNTRVAEDYEVLTDLILHVKTIVYVPKTLYYYMMRDGSLTHNISWADQEKLFDLALDRYEKYYDLYDGISIYSLVVISSNIVIKKYMLNCNIETQRFEKFIVNNILNIIRSREFSLSVKKQCILICLGLAESYYKWKYNK